MKFMVCLDESNTSTAALRLAKKHAGTFGAELILVTSMIKGTENEKTDITEAEKKLESEKNVCEKDGTVCNSHLLIRGLSAGEDLVSFARDQKVDLVYIGIKRRSKVEKIVFGSTAQYVILHADCPVVTVK